MLVIMKFLFMTTMDVWQLIKTLVQPNELFFDLYYFTDTCRGVGKAEFI